MMDYCDLSYHISGANVIMHKSFPPEAGFNRYPEPYHADRWSPPREKTSQSGGNYLKLLKLKNQRKSKEIDEKAR